MILVGICIVSLFALCAYMVLSDLKIQSETDYLSFLVYTSLSDLASPEATSDEQGEKEFPL